MSGMFGEEGLDLADQVEAINASLASASHVAGSRSTLYFDSLLLIPFHIQV